MAPQEVADQDGAWKSSTRVAFRFFFLLVLFYSITALGYEVLSRLPFTLRPAVFLQYTLVMPRWAAFVHWVGPNVLHVATIGPPNAGPPKTQLVGLFCVASLALLGAAAWSVADRRRTEYRTLYGWLRTYCRFAAAVLLMSYGAEKVLITQADYPPLPSALLKPMGAFDPATLFFAFLATSPVYQAFAGSVELLAGLLLIPRRTVTLGALLACAAMANVLVVNWSFRIAMYRISLSTFVMAGFLLLPELRRLANVLVLNRPVSPATRPPLFSNVRFDRVAQATGVCFLIAELAFLFNRNLTEGAHWRGRPPLWGAYVVESFERTGATTSPELDGSRWVQLAVDQKPSFNQAPADAFGTIVTIRDTIAVLISVDTAHRMLAFTTSPNSKRVSRWSYANVDTNHLELRGMDDVAPVRKKQAAAAESPLSNASLSMPHRNSPDSLRITLRRLDLMSLRLYHTRAGM